MATTQGRITKTERTDKMIVDGLLNETKTEVVISVPKTRSSHSKRAHDVRMGTQTVRNSYTATTPTP